MKPDYERRERVLTEADLEVLRETIACHTCSFTPSQVDALQSVANNLNTTQKVMTKVIIYGIVTTTIGFIVGGIVMGVKHFIVTAVSTGNIPGK